MSHNVSDCNLKEEKKQQPKDAFYYESIILV